jgi:hypothetical protein
MSQRLGMADGRCHTINNSSKLYDNFIKTQNGIKFEDNYSFRKLLQDKGPAIHVVPSPQNDGSPCGLCDSTLDLSEIN